LFGMGSCGSIPSMFETSLLTIGLAFLVPLGYALIALGGLDEGRARHAALGVLAALGLAVLGYVAVGFALEFGGVGLAHSLPGVEGLVWEWSALGATWGTGWGTAGLVGWGMAGPAVTAGAYHLALANLPWVATAALIPLVCLRGRIPAWASGLIGLVMGALIYPLAGNWIWGGGWLANLGSNLGLGHGLVDAGGSGLVHLLGAAATLAGILVFLPRVPKSDTPGEPVPLPPVHLPLLAVLGCGLLLAGGLSWTVSNPLLMLSESDLPRLALNTILAASSAAFLPLFYTWFVAGRTDPLMAARGFAAGSVAIAAGAPFMPPWAALALGAAIGLTTVFVIFVVDRLLRWDDPTAALTVHGLAGGLGLLAVGVFADGRAGAGWNGAGAVTFLGVPGQGVTGLLAAPGFQPDWPGQMGAQLVGLAALALLGFFAAWLFTAPLSLLIRLLSSPHPDLTPAPDVAETPPTGALRASQQPLPVDDLESGEQEQAPTGDTLALERHRPLAIEGQEPENAPKSETEPLPPVSPDDPVHET
jgi:ammonium transporter, Amt family